MQIRRMAKGELKMLKNDDKEWVRERRRRYREANRERIAAYNRKWNQEHPRVKKKLSLWARIGRLIGANIWK
jgi:hypothetical protein